MGDAGHRDLATYTQLDLGRVLTLQEHHACTLTSLCICQFQETRTGTQNTGNEKSRGSLLGEEISSIHSGGGRNPPDWRTLRLLLGTRGPFQNACQLASLFL